ncbi:MAG: class I adenylate-forming enzyme family protein, partial [Pseudomonadota bacterium]
MNLAEHLHRAAKARPSSPAIYEGATLVQTYADLNERAARLASGLRFIMGLGAGERVAILSKNGPRYLEALYAVWRAGLVATP